VKVVLIGGPQSIEGLVMDSPRGRYIECVEPPKMTTMSYSPSTSPENPITYARHRYYVSPWLDSCVAIHESISPADALERVLRVFEKVTEGLREPD
jgi:hypothetical protein